MKKNNSKNGTIIRETYDEELVKLNELNWDNRRMKISYGNLWVNVYFDGFDSYSVYYYDRRMAYSIIPNCCKAPGKYKNIKSATTQIKKFFRNW